MIIRRVTPKDIAACVRLSKIPQLSGTQGSSDKNIEWYLRCYLKKGILVVAVIDDEVVGYLAAEVTLGNIVLINFLVVNEAWRGQGIGRQLMKWIETFSRKKKYIRLFLVAPAKFENTLRFYESIGMEKGETLIEFSKKLY